MRKTYVCNGGVSVSSETVHTDIENNFFWSDFADLFMLK